jgi:two-component system response regulator PilR (NtrC family)
MRACHLAEWPSSTRIVGQSTDTIRLRAEISRVAPFTSNVLITGPSGTGKELVAREIHSQSPRARQPFIPVDCASIVGDLMSSQLFGHMAGAFTGANCDSLGSIRAADHGTLFLDEIGELDYSLQAKLLRVLQEHVVTPVGSHEGQLVDVRVIAATNRDLQAEVLVGRFREDLYYRLHVAHLRTTPLQNRPDDVCVLAAAFLEELADEGLPWCSLSPEATDVLLDFHWPGNVRQLRNVLEQAVIDSASPIITAELLHRIISFTFARPIGAASGNFRPAKLDVDAQTSASLQTSAPPSNSPLEISTHVPASQPPEESQENWISLKQLERRHILRTLEHTYFNRSAAARLLGVTRQSLLRKIKQHGLDVYVKPS